MSRGAARKLDNALRTSAAKECGVILQALSSHEHVHTSVHEARKGIRRLRALLALIEDALEEALAVDIALQRLGDSLSRLRDAHVLVEEAARLAGKHSHAHWTEVMSQLTERRERTLSQTLAQDPHFWRRRSAIEQVAAQLDRLPWNEVKAADVRKGLKRSQRRVAKAEERASSQPGTENLHRWRRRARRLRMQNDLLEKLQKKAVKQVPEFASIGHARALGQLSDVLGTLRDVAALQQVVRRLQAQPHKAEVNAQLRKELAEVKATLAELGFDVQRA